jgi:hypothetical protein
MCVACSPSSLHPSFLLSLEHCLVSSLRSRIRARPLHFDPALLMHSARSTPTSTASRPRASSRSTRHHLQPAPRLSDPGRTPFRGGRVDALRRPHHDLVLVRHGAGLGKQVAAIGVGGVVRPLPHTAPHVLTAALGRHRIIFCSALGAEFTAFSRHANKLADAKTLDAAEAVHAVGDSFAEPYSLEFDLTMSTADVTKKSPLDPYMKCVSRRLSRTSPCLSSRRLPHRARPFVLVDRG